MKYPHISGIAYLIIACLFISAGCSEDSQLDPTQMAFSQSKIKAGEALFPTYCNTCHEVKDRESDMLAPSLWAIRQHYLAKHPEPIEFVNAMTEFMEAPAHETSLMPHAIEQYGLMSYVSLSSEQLRLTSIAIYSGAVKRPNWAKAYDKKHQAHIESLTTEN